MARKSKLEQSMLGGQIPTPKKHKTALYHEAKAKKSISYQTAATKGNKRFYPELRLKQKAANERMRQLEKLEMKSPAYQAVQAKLEILGKSMKGNRGRRFSETGKATYNEMEVLNKVLDEFLYGDTTSTIKGARDYWDDVWTTANKNAHLNEIGISREEWLDFWESMPDKKERLYGSSQNVAIIRAFAIKKDANRTEMQALRDKRKLTADEQARLEQLEDLNSMTAQEIVDEIQASKNLKNAYSRLGLTYNDVKAARIDYQKARKGK